MGDTDSESENLAPPKKPRKQTAGRKKKAATASGRGKGNPGANNGLDGDRNGDVDDPSEAMAEEEFHLGSIEAEQAAALDADPFVE